jgi:glycylpeptide N-tetradecanoyltransferase
LTENYVEDDDSSFRFDYSREFLKWALTPPNYQKTWLVGVRGTNEKLYASITGVPVHTYVEDDKIKMA